MKKMMINYIDGSKSYVEILKDHYIEGKKPDFKLLEIEIPDDSLLFTKDEVRQIGEGVKLQGRSYKKIKVIYTN